MTPTSKECHKDFCVSADQQFSRIVRRWAAEPLGQFEEGYSNHERLRSAIEYFIQPILKQSPDESVHEFWSDGVELIESFASSTVYFFGGACIFSDRHANWMWLAPFELRMDYNPHATDCPSSVDLKLGHRDLNERISKQYPTGRKGYRLYAMSHCLYGNRPKSNENWAVHVNLSPYTGR